MKKHKNNAELFADARRSLLGNLSVAVWSFLLFASFISDSSLFLLSFMTLSLTVASDLPVGGGDGGQSQSSVVEEREESSPVCQ